LGHHSGMSHITGTSPAPLDPLHILQIRYYASVYTAVDHPFYPGHSDQRLAVPTRRTRNVERSVWECCLSRNLPGPAQAVVLGMDRPSAMSPVQITANVDAVRQTGSRSVVPLGDDPISHSQHRSVFHKAGAPGGPVLCQTQQALFQRGSQG